MADDPRWTRVMMWRPVRETFAAAEALLDEARRQRDAAEREAAHGGAEAPGPPPSSYLRKRAAVREALIGSLDPSLTEHLGLWQKHLSMIAVTAFVDERERVTLGPLTDTWRLPLMQSELLGVDDGGDRFFTQLLELMARADVHELVLELHLLCLRAGFLGRYRDRRHELARLIEQLGVRIQASTPARPAGAPRPVPRRPRVGFAAFPWRYYAAVVLAIAALFLAMRAASSREVAESHLVDCGAEEGGQAR